MERKSIGGFIAALRKANGLTQKQLADKLNVSDKAVSRWERDECAPDLSLIPVIAEIFNITADELLCGERRTESTGEANPRRTEKQKKRILTQTMSKFRLQSLISIGITAIALITAAVLEIYFENHYITMLVPGVLTSVSVICEAVFLGNIIRSASDEEFDDIKTDEFKINAVNFSKIPFAISFAFVYIYVSLLFFLPFCSGMVSNSLYEMLSAISPTSPHGIFSPDILLIALLYAGGGVILFKTIWCFALKALKKRGVYPTGEKDSELLKFKKRFFTAATAVIAASLILCTQASSCQEIFEPLLSNKIEIDNIDDFVSLMEEKVYCSEYILEALSLSVITSTTTVAAEDGEYFSTEADEEICDENGNVIAEFCHNNNEIYTYETSYEDGMPVSFSVSTLADYYRSMLALRCAGAAVITAEMLTAYVLYAAMLHRKKKKLNC